jgi:hypothetical protein
MTDGDDAAVDVEDAVIDAELVAAVDAALRGTSTSWLIERDYQRCASRVN